MNGEGIPEKETEKQNGSMVSNIVYMDAFDSSVEEWDTYIG